MTHPFLFIFLLCITLQTLENMRRQKKYKAQGFYIEKEFECLCVIILGHGRVSSSTGLFLVGACFANQGFAN